MLTRSLTTKRNVTENSSAKQNKNIWQNKYKDKGDQS